MSSSQPARARSATGPSHQLQVEQLAASLLHDSARGFVLDPLLHRNRVERVEHFGNPANQADSVLLLDRVLDLLREEYSLAGRLELFDGLKEHLTREKGSTPYREVARRVGLSEGAVKVAVHRLRRRYRELLEAEIAHTVSEPADVEDEMQQLFTALSSEKNAPR